MGRRAQLVDRTRQRITEAAIRLHTSVGPARTSLSAIAEEAGVTRLTLYRHFSNQDELFAACMGHWAMRNPSPDISRWRRIQDPWERAPRALEELYAWYRAHGEELYPIYRDRAAMPAGAQQAQRVQETRMIEALITGWRQSPRLRAAAGHVVSFMTWRSLAVDGGLDDGDAVQLAVDFLRAASEG